ncbi:hypothetical protein DL89DRAFT_290106 [Linderina pennispora]|uniref:Mitochondrial import inner membrane translocase subunit TIM50 n=1 Tax=Linderina pennispora TaxID=61395 RepID=A0A1Y1WN93_9FUNG|nr:uncharacterized protein DL89DRAFT_290106 [Linderina pennispora]ORX74584.1 hypothetical protein DL89DRAFT_290106 [Linderina pennispora]
MFGRFASPLARQVQNGRTRLPAAAARLQARALGTTMPSMIRIRKSSESVPEPAKKPEETEPKPISAEEPAVETGAPKAEAEAPTKSAASPFGFASTGGGMASGILGNETGEPVGNEGHDQSRDGMTAAEARRARRQRADLPPLEDEPRVKAAKYAGTGLAIGLVIGAVGYFGRPYTSEEIEKGLSDNAEQNFALQLWHRVLKRGSASFSFLSDPVSEKLLPEPADYMPPYTLESGWRIAKRPGLDHFLAYMASMYELVIFSTQPSHSGELVMSRLDPLGYAPYRLYREHMRNIDGKNYKDLSALNRDMSKVIMIDIDPEAFELQPESDNWIEQMTQFLEYVSMMEPKDVRPWLKTYKGMDGALEFSKWQDSIRKQLVDEWEEKRKNANSWKAAVFGGGPADMDHPPEPEFDRVRKLMRENFEAHHKEMLVSIEKERQQYEEEMKQQMKDMTIWKMLKEGFSQGQPAPADAPAPKQ